MALIDEESDYDMLVTAHHFAHITNKIKTKLDTLLLNKLLIQTINSILVTQGKIEDKNTSPNGITTTSQTITMAEIFTSIIY
jgi:hypothetical protein